MGKDRFLTKFHTSPTGHGANQKASEFRIAQAGSQRRSLGREAGGCGAIIVTQRLLGAAGELVGTIVGLFLSFGQMPGMNPSKFRADRLSVCSARLRSILSPARLRVTGGFEAGTGAEAACLASSSLRAATVVTAEFRAGG